MSEEFIALLAAAGGLVTAIMNVYTYVTTGGQIKQLIAAIDRQATSAGEANGRLADVLDVTQRQLEKLIDRILR
jgi:hypothetical protein